MGNTMLKSLIGVLLSGGKCGNNKFPLHIPLDRRTKTTGMILTEHVKCLDVASRNIQYVEKIPEDILNKTLEYVKAFF